MTGSRRVLRLPVMAGSRRALRLPVIAGGRTDCGTLERTRSTGALAKAPRSSTGKSMPIVTLYHLLANQPVSTTTVDKSWITC